MEILDDKPKSCEENTDTKFSIYCLVQTIWITDNWQLTPEQAEVFGYRVNLQGGKVMELETLPNFKKHWDIKGGLPKFQKHLCDILQLDK